MGNIFCMEQNIQKTNDISELYSAEKRLKFARQISDMCITIRRLEMSARQHTHTENEISKEMENVKMMIFKFLNQSLLTPFLLKHLTFVHNLAPKFIFVKGDLLTSLKL